MIMLFSFRKEVEPPNSLLPFSICWHTADYRRRKKPSHHQLSTTSLLDLGLPRLMPKLNDYQLPLLPISSHTLNHVLPLPRNHRNTPHYPSMTSTISQKTLRLFTIARTKRSTVFNSQPIPLRLTRSHSTNSPPMFHWWLITRHRSFRDLYQI